jgi:antirestriction protein
MPDTPQVWVGCLASYNAGRLIGEWVDATDADEIGEAQKRVATTAVAAAKDAGEYPIYFGEPEEFFIADYDGFPEAAVKMLGEYASYETIATIAQAIEAHGEPFGKWLNTLDSIDDVDDLADRFQESYRGEWESEEAFAMELATDLGLGGIEAVWERRHPMTLAPERVNVIDELSNYIDWERVARDYFDHGEYTFDDGSVFEDMQQ